MNNSEKILKMVSKLIETGVLTSQDVAKSIITSAKFNKFWGVMISTNCQFGAWKYPLSG